MQAKRLIIGYIFYISLSFLCVYVYGFEKLARIWAPFMGYYIFTYFLHIAWSKIRKKQTLSLFEYFVYFLYKSAIYLCITITIVGGFFFYQNDISPARLPTHTLSNGKQTIIFQTMSHIGAQSFYDTVQENIHLAKKQDFVLYYEGVLAGSEKNSQDFNQALGIEFEAGLYDNFSKLYGVQAQDNNDFLGLVNNLDYNIDISLDEVMRLYREKTENNEKNDSIIQNKQVHNLNSQVISKLSTLSEKELSVLRYINQAMLNFMMKHEGLRNTIIARFGNADIFAVILEDRNKHLTNEILSRGDEKIIVLYGLMHFPGVLELLQNHDKNWKITHSDYTQIITR